MQNLSLTGRFAAFKGEVSEVSSEEALESCECMAVGAEPECQMFLWHKMKFLGVDEVAHHA